MPRSTLTPTPLVALCLSLGFIGLVGGADFAGAERGFVVSTGGDASVAIPEAQESAASSSSDPHSAFGYFGRLSWESSVPQYTMAERGYRWSFGLGPDVEFSRSRQLGGGQSSAIATGMRLNIGFSQRRMGLLQVSARGGFWVALRAGLQVTEGAERVSHGMESSLPAGMLVDMSLGEFILLGDSGLRVEVEFSTLMAERTRDPDASGLAIRLRGGLGAYF